MRIIVNRTSATTELPATPSPPRRSANKRVSTRERILAAATRLFAERGFESASMPAIAKASGITAGAIYKHFRSKGELLLEVVKDSFLTSPLFTRTANGVTDAASLPQLAALYAAPELKLVRQLSIEVHSAARKDAQVRKVLALTNRIALDHFRDTIARAQREGRLDPQLDPAFAARMLTVTVLGLAHMDTLIPELIGNRAWSDFVRDRIANVIGLPTSMSGDRV